MAIRTQESLSGFIASDPQLTYTERGDARYDVDRTPRQPFDRDRPTRQTTWPGEEPQPAHEESVITDRDSDFVQFVIDQVNERQAAEDAFYASLDDRIDPATGEVRDDVLGPEGG